MFRILSMEEKNPTRVGLITILNNSTASLNTPKVKIGLSRRCVLPLTHWHTHTHHVSSFTVHMSTRSGITSQRTNALCALFTLTNVAEAAKPSSLRWVQRPTSSATLRNAINTPKGVGLRQFQRFFSTPFFCSSQLHMGVSVLVRVRGVADRTDRPGTTSIRAC